MASDTTQGRALRKLAIEDLPPYGFMPVEWQGEVREGAPPAYWRQAAGQWKPFRDGMRDVIAKAIWPVYRQRAEGSKPRGWQPGPAASNAMALTELDLDLMVHWSESRFRSVGWDRDALFSTHEELFYLEDDRIWDESLLRYCPGFKLHKEALVNAFLAQLDKRISDGCLALKWEFQRPRPWQVAYLQERDDWFWGFAKTSMSPSMISGHALQGIVYGCVLFSVLNRMDKELMGRNREGLQRWMMGVGDRRVFAGVHYPSDNVASWIVACRLVPEVVEGAEVVGFLREAIEDASLVHRDLAAMVADRGEDNMAKFKGRGGPFAEPLAALKTALSEMPDRAPTR